MFNFQLYFCSIFYFTWFVLDANATDRPLIGGIVETDPNSTKSWSIAWRAIKPLNEKFNDSDFYYIPKKIISATSQVVQGTSDVLKVEFVESNCSREQVKVEDVTTSNCAITENGKVDVSWVANLSAQMQFSAIFGPTLGDGMEKICTVHHRKNSVIHE